MLPGAVEASPYDYSAAGLRVAERLGLPIPGYPAGAYTGSSHGPATGEWMVWSGLTTVGHNGSVAQAGDLAVWQTHMGICLGPNSMISAQDPANGTQVSAINGFIPELLFIRRY